MISEELIQKKMDSMDGGEGLTFSEEVLFRAGVEFAEEYYLEKIKPVSEKVERLLVKIAEIKGGVYNGQYVQ